MTSPGEPTPDIVGAAVEEVIAQATRLGLKWTLIPGTVSSVASATGLWPASNTWVVQDNDTNPTRAMSLIGPVAEATRVMIMHVPPQGNYIIGTVGGLYPIQRDFGEWIEYGTPTTLWTSTGATQPAIGNGSIVGKFSLLNSKTCAFRIRLSIGSTTTLGTAGSVTVFYQFLLPFPIADEQTASAIFRDNSGANQYSFTAWLQSGTLIHSVSSSTATRWNSVTPVAWETGDRAEITGVYQIS